MIYSVMIYDALIAPFTEFEFMRRALAAVLAALHDMDLVRANFPETLLLARGQVAWGATAEVLTSDNLQEARRMCEAFDDSAAACAVDDMPSRAA